MADRYQNHVQVRASSLFIVWAMSGLFTALAVIFTHLMSFAFTINSDQWSLPPRRGFAGQSAEAFASPPLRLALHAKDVVADDQQSSAWNGPGSGSYCPAR